jgi:hypothetical protein
VFALCLVPFVVLATLNSGGYRYGASDQAFYQPAVLAQLDPALFPRDLEVLGAQTHLTLADETMAALVRITGLSVPAVFALLYAGSLVLFAWAVWLIGIRLYTSIWTAAGLLAAFTLRHAIARSGTNTLEGYFQPRLLAYALGAAGIAAFLRGRIGLTSALILIAAAVHPTTAAWFAVWLVVATAIARPEWRRTAYAVMALAAAAAAWLLFGGPLTSRLGTMDAEWRQLLEAKTYLFPLEWPAYAWILNLGYLAVIAWIFRLRQRAGLVDPAERGLVLGSASLAAVFFGALVAQVAGIALAFQLQPARVFWMFDFLAVTYGVWLLAWWGAPLARHARTLALAALAFSAARGVYVIVQAERPPVQLAIPDDDWGRVMAFARSTDKSSGWLADPLHAVLYGTSVRVAGERDVLVESVKDAALGMYDRRIAVRTGERIRAVGEYNELTADEARRLGARYDLDYMITERDLDLPRAFTSGNLHVYRLRE